MGQATKSKKAAAEEAAQGWQKAKAWGHRSTGMAASLAPHFAKAAVALTRLRLAHSLGGDNAAGSSVRGHPQQIPKSAESTHWFGAVKERRHLDAERALLVALQHQDRFK